MRREKKKRNRLGRREKLAQKSREEGEIGAESREKGDLTPCSPTSNMVRGFQAKLANTLSFCCPSITKRDLQLDTKKTLRSPESHDNMSEY